MKLSSLAGPWCLLVLTIGCSRPAVPPAGSNLPPAYPHGKLIDPRLEAIASQFRIWIEKQQRGDKAIFSQVDVLPPVETLQPYGVGTLEKQLRVPAILITGPGWSALPEPEREALTALIFQELAKRLAATPFDPSLRPTLTVQTPQGLELAWVNETETGRKLLHGEDE